MPFCLLLFDIEFTFFLFFFFIKEKHKHLKAQYKYQSVKNEIKNNKTRIVNGHIPINVTYSTVSIQINR